MRTSFIALFALAACSEAGAPPPARSGLEQGSVRYICSVANEEAAIFTTRDGEDLAPMPTGRGCSYDAYEAHRRGWGEEPVREPSPSSLSAWEASQRES